MFGCTLRSPQETLRMTSPVPIQETSTIIPTQTLTLTPSPFPTPVYSYLPAISEANVTEVVDFYKFDGGVNSLAISPNGKYLAATFENGVGIIWDISRVKANDWQGWGKVLKDVFSAKGAVSFSSDSSVLATGGTLIELSSKKIIQELPGTVVFSPTEQTLALMDWMTISFWSFDGTEWVLDYKQESEGVVDVAFSPDGNLLGEALRWGGGEGVNIWRVSDYTLLYSFPPTEHSHPAHFNFSAYAFLSFSPDNHFVATGTKDQYTARVWDLQTGDLVKDISTVVEGEDGDFYLPHIACASFSQDSTVIALAGYNTIIFKTIPDGEYIRMVETSNTYNYSPSNTIRACATSNDGKLLVVGNSGGTVSIWGISAPSP